MKRYSNTLYVTTQGSYLTREGKCILVRVEKKVRLRLPAHTIGSVICIGRTSFSPGFAELCSEHGITVCLLSRNGRFIARLEGPTSGNVLLRFEQYQRSKDLGFCRSIVSNFVIAKIANARHVLLRHLRDHGDQDRCGIREVVQRLGHTITRLPEETSLDVLRGLEGEAAKSYFSVFDGLIVAQKESFRFVKRSRRPPMDKINAVLSFLYALLLQDARTALECVGLDPSVGFLHSMRPGRPSLALDLMEEFRPILADRLALTLINRRQINKKGFKTTASMAIKLEDDTRRIILDEYQKRKEEEILHSFLNERIKIGLVLLIQARLIARYLRGDLDGYPAFFWK